MRTCAASFYPIFLLEYLGFKVAVNQRIGLLSVTKVPTCLKNRWNNDLQNGKMSGLRSDVHATIYQILEVHNYCFVLRVDGYGFLDFEKYSWLRSSCS